MIEVPVLVSGGFKRHKLETMLVVNQSGLRISAGPSGGLDATNEFHPSLYCSN